MTLYDLTNTFFEGAAAAQPKAERGHSKEKRSDCPLLTLGLVLDGSGFVRRSEVFSGAVNEDKTLASMLTATFRRKDGRTLHVRKATRAEPEQQKIFRALGIDPAPGGIRKMIV